jgi:hypothetical protein
MLGNIAIQVKNWKGGFDMIGQVPILELASGLVIAVICGIIAWACIFGDSWRKGK